MATIRKFIAALVVAAITSFGLSSISSAQADDCNPGPCLGPPPLNVAAPRLHHAKRIGFVHAHNPNRAHSGKPLRINYGRVRHHRFHEIGHIYLWPGHTKVFHVPYNRIDWNAVMARGPHKGQLVAAGVVRHIYCR